MNPQKHTLIPIEDYDSEVVGAFYTVIEANDGPLIRVYKDKDDRFPMAVIIIEVCDGHPRLLAWFNNEDDADVDILMDDEAFMSRGCLVCGEDWDDHPTETCKLLPPKA